MTSLATTRPQQPARQIGGGAPAGSAAMGLAPIDPLRLLKRFWPVLAVSLVVGAVLGVIAHLVVSRVYPLYRTEVLYQVLAPLQDPTKGINTGQDKDEMERFLLTQSRVISSDKTLRASLVASPQVFESDTDWGRRTLDDTGKVEIGKGLNELKKVVRSSVISGTNLVSMTITVNSANDASLIARAVHDAYWTDWRALSGKSSLETREPIERELQRLRTELTRLDQSRDRLLNEKSINELQTQRQTSEDVEISALQPLIADTREQIKRYESIIRQYEALAQGAGGSINFPDEVRDLVERDPVVIETKQRISSLRTESQSSVQLGEDHPYNRQSRRRIEAAEAELASQREQQMRKLFDAELDRTRRALEGSQNVLTEVERKLAGAVARKQDIVRTLATYEQLMDDRKRIQDEIERNRQALTSIQLTQDIRDTGGERVDRIRVLVPPAKPDEIYFPKLTIMIPLGIALAFGLTAGVIVLRELLDQRIKGPSDLASIPRVRLVGMIPAQSDDPTRPPPETAFRDAPTGAIADGYRQLRANLVKRMQQAGYKSLLVVAGNPGSGASSAACNIALGAAASDQRVLIIDANFRRPSLHRIFKLGEAPGLGEVLARAKPLEAAIQQTSTPNLHILAAGAASNRVLPERLATDLMAQVIADASAKYDLVVIDTAPAAIAGDAYALANRVDCSLLVIRSKNEKRGLIARLRDQLADARGEFLGVAIQGVEATRAGYMAKNIRAAQDYAANNPA
jgi:capsular exopolysaccharide synthesis family protein